MTNTPRTYPILDEDLLLSMPKAQKPQDMERILTSPNSEDWVTWNLMRALQRSPGDDWWSGVVAAAEADARHSARWSVLEEPPTVELWRTVPSPSAYEAASRQRMATSENAEWRTRAENRRAVEGSTEVDLLFDGADYLVFVEAKLRSDISPSTTYDLDRNQIVRNIDCVIEEAGDREPFFWMLVRDRSTERLYMQVLDRYRVDPSELHRLLPHRDPAVLDAIIETIAVITWEDLLPFIPNSVGLSDTVAELTRRVSEH
ncbi:MAG: hypothetical protein M3094_06860 [Actinomycetia bacterium]|nr:hypothetical protein [Actinomycetes bacterium]